MILNRIGNKKKLLSKILPYFPPHDIYIEMFFGSGSVFFNKPHASYSILNDYDNEVYNVFNVLIRHKNELKEYLELIPYHSAFWDECKTRKPDNDIERAVYFLVLSNFGFLSKHETLKYGANNSKQILIDNITKAYNSIVKNGNQFLNDDFRNIFKKISWKDEIKDKNRAFIYADPPYLDTENNYNVPNWTAKDTLDCFETTFNQGIKAALSEFDHPYIIELSNKMGLKINHLGERQNIKNRRNEVLITNYNRILTLF